MRHYHRTDVCKTLIALAAKEKSNDSTTLASFRMGRSHVRSLSLWFLAHSPVLFCCQTQMLMCPIAKARQAVQKQELLDNSSLSELHHVGKHYQNTDFLFSEEELKKTAVYLSITEQDTTYIPSSPEKSTNKNQVQQTHPTDIWISMERMRSGSSTVSLLSLFFSDGNKIYLNLSLI